MTEFSIVIRSRNESKWLPFTLEAIKKQSKNDHEVVLVDNQSTDDSVGIARKFGVKKIVNLKQFRPGHALNLGASYCEGKKIVFLSAHCIPADEYWLDNLGDALDEAERIFCAYGRQLPLAITSDKDRRDLINTFGLDSKVQVKDFFFHNANSIVFADYIAKHPFDNQVTNVEDRLWAKEVINRGDRIAYTPDACVFHYHGINHDNEPSRLKRVTSIIRPLYEQDSYAPQKMIKPNIKILAVIMSNEGQVISQETHVKVLESLTLSDWSVDQVIVSRFPYPYASTRNLLRAQLPQLEEESILGAMKLVLEEVEKSSQELYDHVIFVNPEYVEISRQLVERLISQHMDELLDVTFCAKSQRSNIWQTTTEGLLPLQSNNLFSEDREFLHIAYYGLGAIATRGALLSDREIPQFIGVLALPQNYNTERKLF